MSEQTQQAQSRVSGFMPAGGFTVKLQSLPPSGLFDKLDLTRPELASVAQAYEQGDSAGALAALLTYYRQKYPLGAQPAPPLDEETRAAIARADEISRHIFQWGPHPPADYGPDIDWAADPAADIEWVASVYRFYWAIPLAEAYEATRNEAYGRAFVELVGDWMAKHPLEEHERVHPVYDYWVGFAWLDLQTGIRATNLCSAFRRMVHSEAFTPEFLGRFLAGLYDHQTKTQKIPMGRIHNKAIFEQRGFINVAYTFPEFRESREWLQLGLDRSLENFLAQTTEDGVQREWSGGYHTAVLRDVIEIAQRMEASGIAVPAAYQERLRGMVEYCFGISTPFLEIPMFGDTRRAQIDPDDRSTWSLYSMLIEEGERLGDPKYAALARLDRAHLPPPTSYAFRHAGFYAMRNDWGPEAVYLALHCSPPAITSHDQPDNGTIELFAYGRMLLPDSGFYKYGSDPVGRAWHRQTQVHQTLTLDGQDSQDAASQLIWQSEADFDLVTVENQSYPTLAHRRTIWFVNKQSTDAAFFVFLDEALGEADGALDLHFQFAPGPVQIDVATGAVTSCFDDANVLVQPADSEAVTASLSRGWYAWDHGQRAARAAVAYRHTDHAPAVFLTAVVPYRGSRAPEVQATIAPGFAPGAARVEVSVQVFGREWRLGRDLESGEGWVTAQTGG